MALTVGTGPFGQRPGGEFNAAVEAGDHILYFEDSPRRMRATMGGETVVDSRNVKLLHESGLLPIAYFPESDVRMDLLEPTDHHTHCPVKGDASYYSVRVGGRVAENAAWTYPEPIAGAPALAGHIAFQWHELDVWYEEDEEVFGHLRDPYHRIDVIPTSRLVRVSAGGELLAETTRAQILFETGLPPRYYIPEDDVRRDALTPSGTHTVCAYKGTASYHSIEANGATLEDVVWWYPEPHRSVRDLAGHLCFFNEKLDIELDGELQERPQTPWS